ncbi:MAG: hypothetical protein QOD37_1867, partial [Gaiellales bacterium]|nr:hypothetical protein [Gaiellales bacterium]
HAGTGESSAPLLDDVREGVGGGSEKRGAHRRQPRVDQAAKRRSSSGLTSEANSSTVRRASA